jgi:hypothetical protein
MTARDTEVRWGLEEDEKKVAVLLELNGTHRWIAFETRFVVAEREGEVLAAVAYWTGPKRLCLGLLVVDPWAGERDLVVALYAGARRLAREAGIRQVWVEPGDRRHYLLDAGYRRRLGGWRSNTGWVREDTADLPQGGWRRVLALLGEPAIPFFRRFVGDLREWDRDDESGEGTDGHDV